MQSGFKPLARMTLSTGWSQTLRFHDCRLAQYGNETEFRTTSNGKSLHGGKYDRHDELGDAPRYLRRLTSNADKLWTSSGFNRLSRNGDEGRTSLIKICWDPYEGRIEILPDSTKIVSQCLPGLFEESDILRSCCSFFPQFKAWKHADEFQFEKLMRTCWMKPPHSWRSQTYYTVILV